jgi:hypothetical protein
MPPKQKQKQKRETDIKPKDKEKIKIVKINEIENECLIENTGERKKGYLIEKTYQILDSKGKETKINRELFVEKMNKYSENLKPGTKFQICTFFENVGWRSVNGGHMITQGEDCAKYIFSGNYDDGEWSDLGDILAFTLMIYPDIIEK